jgi:hypothetical protein
MTRKYESPARTLGLLSFCLLLKYIKLSETPMPTILKKDLARYEERGVFSTVYGA